MPSLRGRIQGQCSQHSCSMGTEKISNKHEIVIFLAEDDNDDVLLFKGALEELQIIHQLHVFNNGQQLIDQLGNEQIMPDIIFLDINMPRRNGLETLAEIKDGFADRIPVLVISTSSTGTMIEASKMLGASGYVCKPASFTVLCSILSEALAIDWRRMTKSDFIVYEPAES